MKKFLCVRHGEYEAEAEAEADTWTQVQIPHCLKCLDVNTRNLCVDCEKHKATETVSDSALDYIHGFSKRLCLCCHVKHVEEHLAEVQAGLLHWKEKLRQEPCLVP